MASSTTRRRVGATVELDGAKEYKEAIEELKTLKKLQRWFLKYSDYYKAITVAISALEKQEQA